MAEKAIWGLCGFVIAYGIPLFYWSSQVLIKRAKDRPDDLFPNWEMLRLVSIAFFVLSLFRFISTQWLFVKLGDWWIPSLANKPQWTEDSRRDRIERFATVLFKSGVGF